MKLTTIAIVGISATGLPNSAMGRLSDVSRLHYHHDADGVDVVSSSSQRHDDGLAIDKHGEVTRKLINSGSTDMIQVRFSIDLILILLYCYCYSSLSMIL